MFLFLKQNYRVKYLLIYLVAEIISVLTKILPLFVFCTKHNTVTKWYSFSSLHSDISTSGDLSCCFSSDIKFINFEGTIFDGGVLTLNTLYDKTMSCIMYI